MSKNTIAAHTRWVVFIIALLLVGCSTAPVHKGEVIEPVFPADRVLAEDVTYIDDEISDPFEAFNRTIYRFNYHVDHKLLFPVIGVYEFVTPELLQQGVSNFFDNLFDITSFINSVLQLSAKKSATMLGRVVVNTTIGIAGLWDPATRMGLTRYEEDFGQTLGHYGVGNGPFLVIPVLGPSNLRDGVGRLVDSIVFSTLILEPLNVNDHVERYAPYYSLLVIDTRRKVQFRYFETGSPFEYELVRFLYTTKRTLDIAN